jgi:segregation and condensation protein A
MKTKPELKIVVSNIPAEPPAAEAPPEQVEMPFAVVNGEPITQMPRDLYIPPQALEVFLEAFEGPLDLLLYLIRRQNLNILDIPLAEITRQYMHYIEVMTELQLELAGEYMVMAATLAEIKSRMLLPRPKVDEEGNEEDPRAELVRRLQEYERFKRAAEGIDALPRLERDVWTTSAELKDRKVVRLLPQITLQEMLLAFKEVVMRSEMFAHHHIQRERLSVRARMGDILSTLEHSSFVEFVRLFRPEEGRMGVTVTFVAILELVREGLIDIVQAEPFAPLHVRAAGAKRVLRVVADNDAPGAAGEQVFADEPPVVGEPAFAGAAAVAGAPLVADEAVLAGAVELNDAAELDDDDHLDDDHLDGVDDVDDVPVAGEASLVGDESVSGVPVVEVDEFAFDELPALDEAGKAHEYTGTDGPPSPGEESDE